MINDKSGGASLEHQEMLGCLTYVSCQSWVFWDYTFPVWWGEPIDLSVQCTLKLKLIGMPIILALIWLDPPPASDFIWAVLKDVFRIEAMFFLGNIVLDGPKNATNAWVSNMAQGGWKYMWRQCFTFLIWGDLSIWRLLHCALLEPHFSILVTFDHDIKISWYEIFAYNRKICPKTEMRYSEGIYGWGS